LLVGLQVDIDKVMLSLPNGTVDHVVVGTEVGCKKGSCLIIMGRLWAGGYQRFGIGPVILLSGLLAVPSVG
jgi:hypothetical protein